jgi:hypothetical protein
MRYKTHIFKTSLILFFIGLIAEGCATIKPAQQPEVFVQLGHFSSVNAVVFSPDGKTALSGSRDYTLKLWSVDSGRLIRTFQGHSSWVNAVAFSPDGKTALSGHWDNTLKLWSVDNGRLIRTFQGHSSWVDVVTFSPDGKTALSGSWDNTLKLWAVDSGRLIQTFQGHSNEVNAVAFSPDGKTAISGSDDGSIRLWNLQTGKEIAHMVSFKDGKWATVTTKGYYVVSSASAEKHINARIGNQVRGIEQYRAQFNKPELVKVALQSGKTQQPQPELLTGNYRALVIGINYYSNLKDKDLKTAVYDAKAVSNILRNKYGFTVTTLLNEQASRKGILSAYQQLIEKSSKNDNLLIYYAGHGHHNKEMGKAYWVPSDATLEEYDWIIADRITGYMKGSEARKILIVSDSCYSGAIPKTSSRLLQPRWKVNAQTRQRFLKQILRDKSRILISSGGDYPVSDVGGKGHSIFAQAFLDGLQESNPAFTAEELFNYVQQRVAGNHTWQVPGIFFISNSGHQGGDFVFFQQC